MNRLTALGLASLVAYGVLIASKYAGFVSAARVDPSAVAMQKPEAAAAAAALESRVQPLAPPRHITLPMPLARAEVARASPVALEFRSTRDLKAFVDSLSSRRATLSGDERYYLARALEECQFAVNLNEDLVAYAAKQRRQFLASLTAGDPLNAKRIAAYESVDATQRCVRFQNAKFSSKDIEDLYLAAAQQGDPRAQGRLLVAELGKSQQAAARTDQANPIPNDDFARMISLLESQDPEAMLIVGQFLAQNALQNQIRIGPNGEVPEPSAFLGAFSLVACDLGPDCITLSRELQNACAFGGYCNAQTFEELYQNFLASPWAYVQAVRYRSIIHTAINTRNWALIGLVPPAAGPTANRGPQ